MVVQPFAYALTRVFSLSDVFALIYSNFFCQQRKKVDNLFA